MLEGQVAVLSSGYLSSKENLEVLDALKSSQLFRDDQYSYILYPNKDLGLFLNKNTIPSLKVNESKLLRELLNDGNQQIISKDCESSYHFNCDFNNVNGLISELKNLPEKYTSLVKEEYNNILEVFEDVFNHKEFTGRSGTFFGYEGLGSIYWHMVSKLSLAVLETTKKAISEKDNVIIREWGLKPDFDFQVKTHQDLGRELKLIDFERGAKISGSGFPLYTGQGAKLERKLISSMIEHHVDKYGFSEIFPPVLILEESMRTTGQLPKFKEDMYLSELDHLYLAPTAEVPVTNIHLSLIHI